ncbi:hypothetical protein B0T09DRAFT_229600, partial [Sordaria sp. MPI-SDFR-AT-0083]
MASTGEPIESIESTTALVLHNPASFDDVLNDKRNRLSTIPKGTIQVADPPEWLIVLHDQLATAHNQVRDIAISNYVAVASLYNAGIEASQASITRLEHQVQQASTRFASEVWAVVAQFGKKDEERQKAVQKLIEASSRQQQALDVLNERTTRQQSVLGHMDTWATTKETQIEEILNKLVDPSQLKSLEDQITTLQQATQKAITEAFTRSGQPVPDATSVLRILEHRAATRLPSSPSITTAAPEEPSRNEANQFLQNLGHTMTVQATPIHLSKPSSYDGKDLSKFRPWWYKIEASLESYAASFPSDAYKIHWIGSLLTDKAQTWHNQRTKQCQRMGLVDTWTGYSTALKDRFKDPSEQHRNARKMAELKYEGDTVQYITTLLDFNDVVQWSGTTFRNHISKTLPSEIIKMVYHTRGGVPSSDDEFLNT